MPAVHWLEDVGSDLRKIGSAFAGCFRFVSWLVFFATRERQGQTGDKADSGPSETEKIAFGLEERLHRGVIDYLQDEPSGKTILEGEGRRSGC